jgi:hypothetical protein
MRRRIARNGKDLYKAGFIANRPYPAIQALPKRAICHEGAPNVPALELPCSSANLNLTRSPAIVNTPDRGDSDHTAARSATGTAGREIAAGSTCRLPRTSES